MIAMKKIEIRSNQYVFEGGGVIIEKDTNNLINNIILSTMIFFATQAPRARKAKKSS